jgi:hypothetical protein
VSDADARALARLAESLRAELDTEALRIEHVDPAGSLVATVYAGGLRLELAFARPLRLEIEVRRLREEDLWDLWHAPAITFDHAQFDETFLVRGEPADSVRALLDLETRSLFLDVNAMADELALDPRRLAVQRAELEGDLALLAEQTLGLGRRLLGVRSVETSAYR